MKRTCHWLMRQLYNVLAVLMVPAAVYWIYVVDQSYPVVDHFKIVTQVVTPEGVLIDGTMDKRRSCRLIEVVSVVGDSTTPVVSLERGTPPSFKRPVGPQKWGPWLVTADRGDGVKLHAHYQCHEVWEHSHDLAAFVVGLQ